MALTDHSFKLDSRGENVIVFSNNHKNFIAPSNYEERLDWIQKSFDSFIHVVREKDSVKELCTKG
ncbi:MAG: hypothetical protein SGJ27_23620 [Candidatus Melainabacteria bacterium]|nr:hypothetical protein [Candidatus Melainabacteria bacterium]